MTGEGWARKQLKISGNDGCLPVKMWGSEIELVGQLRLGSSVSVINVVTEKYDGHVSVNSTSETRIEV